MTRNAEHYLELVYLSRTMSPNDEQLDALLDEMSRLWGEVLSEDEIFQVESQLDFEDREFRS